MIPDDQIGNLEDLFLTNILNGGTGSSLHLFTNNVLLSPTIRATDLQEATFDGYDALDALSSWIRRPDAETGRQANFVDEGLLQICSGDTDLPQVIYGFYVLMDTGLLASVNKFPTPIVVQRSGDTFVPDVKILWNDSFQDQDNPGE